MNDGNTLVRKSSQQTALTINSIRNSHIQLSLSWQPLLKNVKLHIRERNHAQHICGNVIQFWFFKFGMNYFHSFEFEAMEL